MAFSIKQNDTAPVLSATLKDANDTAIDLTGATLRFHMRKVGETSVKVDAAGTITDEDAGSVEYRWSASDTDTIGSFEAEFEVTYSGGEVETFPNNRYIQVEITDDIA